MTGSQHPAPHRHLVSLWTLLFGATAAPLFWLGQMMLAYLVTAEACYGGAHPVPPLTAPLRDSLLTFDGVAVLMAIAGCAVSVVSWRKLRKEKSGGPGKALETGEGRARFLAMWGILSSLIFLVAIVFNGIAALGVPLCDL